MMGVNSRDSLWDDDVKYEQQKSRIVCRKPIFSYDKINVSVEEQINI